MSFNLLTEHHLEFLSFKGGFTGSSEPTHVKIPHCWKSHVTAQLIPCIELHVIVPHNQAKIYKCIILTHLVNVFCSTLAYQRATEIMHTPVDT